MSSEAPNPRQYVEATCRECLSLVQVKPTRDHAPRLPTGWHRHPKDGALLCARCWHQSFILRAVTFPIAGPVGASWPQLRETLETCWAGSTALSNWAVTEYRLRDVTRRAGMDRLPRMEPIYVYPKARELYPDVDPSALVQLLRSIEGRYRKARYSLIWQSASALPTYRYPVPYPIHNQAWSARVGEDGEAFVDVRLGGQRWTLRLRTGPEFRRQLNAFRAIASGGAVQGSLELYRQRANAGDHRPSLEDHAAGGGARVQYRVMAKLVAWLPRTPRRAEPRKGIMQLRTGPDAFWIAICESREWRLNADHVRRWVAAYRRRLERLAEDARVETSRGSHQAVADMRARVVLKQRHRLDSFCHEASALAAEWAKREGVEAVQYDDSVRSFLPSFPWFQVREKLATKLDERGIRLETFHGPEPAAEPTDAVSERHRQAQREHDAAR